jgi:hypothetical protein
MGMIKDIWDIGKELFAITDKLKAAKKEKKQALANLLEYIGNVLTDTYQKLSKNIYPHGNCEQLEVMGKALYEQLKNVIDEPKARSLSDKLLLAHEVEKLHADVASGKIDKNELKMLDEAAGHFKAVARLMML